MRAPFDRPDEIPVTLLIAVAYVTLAVVTGGLAPSADGDKLRAFGELIPNLVAEGEWWRMLASTFLHGGIVHLAFNTMMLIGIGPALERSIGSARFALLYLASAIGGSIAVCVVYDPRGAVVGGSGALFGLLGGLVAANMRGGRHLFGFLDFEGPRALLGMIGANLLIGYLLPFVSNTAHVGGLLAGFLVTFLFLVPPRTPSRTLVHWRLAVAALTASLLFWSVAPATRWDHLWNLGVESHGARQTALLRAAVMAYYGIAEADDADLERFAAEVLQPAPAARPR